MPARHSPSIIIATWPVMNALLLLNSSPADVRNLSSREYPPSLSTRFFCRSIADFSAGSFPTFDLPPEGKYVGPHWAAKCVIVDSEKWYAGGEPSSGERD